MASSDSTLLDAVTEPPRSPFERVRRRLLRYDCTLAAIPSTVFGAAAASTTASVPTDAAVVMASLFGARVVADVLFVHPPIRSGRAG